MKNLQNYPLNIDFTAAVQNPQVCFADPSLRAAQAAKNKARRVLLWSGNFATVYKLLQGTQAWAVRCFTRPPQSDIKQRYAAISAHLAQHKLPYLVGFEFLERGILVNGTWQPILKMAWVEGVDLDVYIGKNLNDPKQLLHLERQLHHLRQDLHKAQIAHGDLQHGNVMVTTTGELKLVDYDGMYVPALEGMPPNEMGHPNYQSPWRGEADFHSALDDFAFDVMALSLRALALAPDLWQQFHEDNKNLLFRQKDFQEPAVSPVFQAIAELKDRELQNLYQQVWRHCLKQTEPSFKLPINSINWLWLTAGGIGLTIVGALFFTLSLWSGKSTAPNSIPKDIAKDIPKESAPRNDNNGKPATTALKLNRMTLVEQYRAGKRNFGAVNLNGEDLSNLQLNGIELPGAQMERVNLQRTNLNQSNLTAANLRQSNLDKADLTGATITDAVITESSLDNTQLTQVIALRTNFSQSKLNQTNLQQSDCTGAIFTGADLQGANLSQGNFTLTNFRKSKLIRTNMVGSILAGAEIVDGNLNYADLSEANLRSINLTNTNLSSANLTNANLTGASLILVELAGANFTKANLRQIIVQNIGSIESANFSEAQFLAPKTRQILCTLASGSIPETGVSTQASLGCP
ncbi:MAG: pentapeptide repeat-containing protein [Pseudanabaena sp. ELA607]|jgi:uncharacterized protein YjbI with pentapeptide repeats